MPLRRREIAYAPSPSYIAIGAQARNMLLFLQNSAAGNRDAYELRKLLETRTQAMGLPALFINRTPGEPVRRLTLRAGEAIAGEVLEGRDVTLVAVGGDGTVNLAARLALGHGRSLGIIPAGTYNFTARNHGIPEDPDAALELLVNGTAHAVQTGLINERLFLVNAGVGLYAKLQQEREGFKRLLGRHRVVATIAAIATVLRPHRNLQMRIVSDDRIIDTQAATFIVSNNRLQLELIGVRDVLAIGAGQLYGGLLRPIGRFAMLQMMLRGSRGTVLDTPELDTLLLQSLRVFLPASRQRSASVSIDGERSRLPLPLQFQVNPATLMLIKPDTTMAPADAAAVPEATT